VHTTTGAPLPPPSPHACLRVLLLRFNNSCHLDGGGMFVGKSFNMRLTRSYFIGNTAEFSGGGAYVDMSAWGSITVRTAFPPLPRYRF